MADETWPLEFHRYHATDDDSPGNIGWREAAILLSPERERERGVETRGWPSCTHSRDVRIDVFYDLVISLYENLIHRWDEISEFLPGLRLRL